MPARRLDRRLLLGGLASALATPAIAQDYGSGNWWEKVSPTAPSGTPPPPRAIETRKLTPPDFSAFRPDVKFVAGIRPHRGGGMRIGPGRTLESGSRRQAIIHNYGHGGAGLSLAFGAAETAQGLVARTIRAGEEKPHIAILGAGVIGLTTARAVVTRWPGAIVTIYAREREPERTTSFWAGGQFAPAITLEEYTTSAGRKLLHDHLTSSERQFEQMTAKGHAARYGIIRRAAFAVSGRGHVRLLLGENTTTATSYGSWLIDPTRLLPALHSDLAAHGVRFDVRTFDQRADLAALPEDVIINCTGAGAAALFDDQSMRPCRGHLVLLANPGNLDYFLNTWCGAGRVSHIFARHDDIVLGGSIQWEPEGTTFNPENAADVRTCERILRNARGLFAARGQGQCS